MIKFEGRIVQFGFGAVGKSFYEKITKEIQFNENPALYASSFLEIFLYSLDNDKDL